MSHYDTPAIAAPSRLGRLSTPIAGFFRSRLERVARAVRIKREVADLRAMDDYILRDIGVHRADISFAVRNGRLPDR